MTSWKTITTVTLVLLSVFGTVVNRPENWVFDPKTLQAIAKRGIAAAHAKNGANATPEQVISSVIAEVTKVYPLHAVYTNKWIWNNAGGAMGALTVLHASFSEYLIIFGSAVGTEGHSGRYPWAEDFFTIIYGEQWAALANGASPEVYRPGDQHYLPKNTAKQYRMPSTCWALEYARGNIPSMMLFGIADLFSSTVDHVTLYHTIAESAGKMVQNALKGKI